MNRRLVPSTALLCACLVLSALASAEPPETATQPAEVQLPPVPAEPQLTRPVLLPAVDGVQLGACNSTLVVRPSDAPGDLTGARSVKELHLAAGRNEREQFFLLLRPKADLPEVTVSFEPMAGPAEIPAEAWSCMRARAVNVPQRSHWYGLYGPITGPIYDPLEPARPFTAPGGSTTLLVPEVHVPAMIPPGHYSGEIVIKSGKDELARVPVALEVWSVTLPKWPMMQTHGQELERNEASWRYLREQGLTALKYGGGGLKYRWDKKTKTMHLDTEEYRKQLKVLLDEVGMPYISLPPSLLGVGSFKKSYLSTGYAVGSEEFWPVFDAYMKGMADFYRANGWENRVMFKVVDELAESHLPALTKICARAKELFPEVKLVTTTTTMPDELARVLDVWVIPWHFFVTRPDDVARWDELRGRGQELWAYMNSAYTLNAEWTLRALRYYPSVLNKYGFTGNLWWGLYVGGRMGNVWEKPFALRNSKRPGRQHYGNGQLFYPEREHDPHIRPSLRWESYRQGLDEYNMLAMLRDRVREAGVALHAEDYDEIFSPDRQARWWGSMLSTSFRLQTYRRDPGMIERFRQMLALELNAMSARPAALVDCQPDIAWPSPSTDVHVRILTEPGTKIYINGTLAPEELYSKREHSLLLCDEVPLQPGKNIISIHLAGPDGASKTLYRQVDVIRPRE